MSAGFDVINNKGKKPKRQALDSTANDDERPRKRRERKTGAAKPGPKKSKKPVMTNIPSLGRTNIVEAAQANASKPGIPTFTSRDKTTALNELIASIPSADRGSLSSDKSALLTATRKFKGHGAVKSDGQGGWRLRGMESSLYHHQLLGAAFLRERENSDTLPKGGLVCDEMGFGKTIQMIANILDGKPDADNPVKTTLIVAPPALINQWMCEMDKHVKKQALGRILRYHSGSRLISNNVIADLMGYDVILTTYGEVQRSYPIPDPPQHLSSEDAKNAWWKDWYNENVGELHRVKFHRIVLDEAREFVLLPYKIQLTAYT